MRWSNLSLRIISGRAGSGKTTMIHEEIVEDLQNNPLGPPIFIIVPDQMTFSTEYQLTNNYGIEGIMRAQVMTFKRLAWFILQEMGGIARERVDSAGYRMLIRRILDEHKEEFQLFRQAAGKRGFTKEIEKILKEFSQYNINAETIEPLIAELKAKNASETLLAKMIDLQIILQQLKERIGTDYVDGEGYFPLLLEHMPQVKSLRETHIYLDGFVSFTGQEFAILKQLLIYAQRVTIVFPFDNLQLDLLEGAVFHRAATSYEKLKHELQKLKFEQGIEVIEEEHIHLKENYRSQNNDLYHIERNFHAPQFDTNPIRRICATV